MQAGWIAFFMASFAAAAIVLFISVIGAVLLFRPVFQWGVRKILRIVLAEHYPHNLWEMVSALTRIHPSDVVENNLRAERGKVIMRPFGSRRKFLHFDSLIFSPAQIAVLPKDFSTNVDLSVTIGPMAKKPLKLDIPILCGAMGYGVGVSKQVKIAMAKGTAAAGTATNSGEGAFLPEERQFAKHMIMQYHSGKWTKEPDILKQADAIEIHFGQGATVGTASLIPAEILEDELKSQMGLKPEDKFAILHARHQEMERPEDLKRIVDKLRNLTGGVPIGVKMAAGGQMEADLETAIRAGVDFISIDGGQAGTKGGPPILEDDFGLPTIYALSRAVRYLQKRGVKDKISLLTGGGYKNPGECLKAIALGADAVYLGTSLLWAMTHAQVQKALPWEPPTELAFYMGHMKDQFDAELAAQNLTNFLNSYVEEIRLGILALGKTSVKDIGPQDMVSLDATTSEVTGVALAYGPRDETTATGGNLAEMQRTARRPNHSTDGTVPRRFVCPERPEPAFTAAFKRRRATINRSVSEAAVKQRQQSPNLAANEAAVRGMRHSSKEVIVANRKQPADRNAALKPEIIVRRPEPDPAPTGTVPKEWSRPSELNRTIWGVMAGRSFKKPVKWYELTGKKR